MIELRSRGQLLPLWSVGVLSSLVLMYFAINYGNMLRWQIRAQNNADAAASMFVSLQTETWNQMTALLYATDIEEFRIRKQFDNLYNTIHNAGGCMSAGGLVQCQKSFNVLHPLFSAAVTRYSSDAIVLQSVVEHGTFTKMYSPTDANSDMNRLLRDLNKASSCLSQNDSTSWHPQNGDCSFYYQVLKVQQRTGLLSASEDAWNRVLPNPASATQPYVNPLSAECALVDNPSCDTSGVSSEISNAVSANPKFNNEIFSPVQVEVSVCSRVKPIIPSFFGLNSQDFYAVGRAASTAIIVDQDWLQPGAFQRGYNAAGDNSTFQNSEPYGQTADSQVNGPEKWLDFYFGGTGWTNFADGHYETNDLTVTDFEAETAWWSPIPIAPFSAINGAAAQTLIGTSPIGAGSCQDKRTG